MKFKLHNLIFVGMILGVVIGLGLHYNMATETNDAGAVVVKADQPEWIEYSIWTLDLLGPTIFMGALKMIIAPLILASIVSGVTSLPDARELGAIGWKTMAYYACTTSVAVGLGLVFVLAVQPGKKKASESVRAKRVAEIESYRQEFIEAGNDGSDKSPEFVSYVRVQSGAKSSSEHTEKMAKLSGAEERSAGDIFRDDIVKPLLMNPFESISSSPVNSLGIIFFALLLGLACTFVGDAAAPVVSFFNSFNEVIMRITHWLMSVSPFAVMCIMGKLVAENGPGIFETLGWYCGTVIAAILVHVIFLLLVCRFLGGIGPLALWRGLREAWMIAFTTRSSAATLPVTIANLTENLKVSPKVANFSLPLGATMNMDGTALYEGVAIIFLIQIYSGLVDVPIELGGAVTLVIFVTAVLASVGAAAVPDAGLVTMVLVASAVHLPIYYIPLIFAVDAFLDMFRTSTNVLGDSVGAIVVNRLERGKLGDVVVA